MKREVSEMESLSRHAVFAPRTPRFESFDPLEADRTVNLSLMRMLYLTPIEVTVENRLTSQVLEQFSYDPQRAVVEFEVREGMTFSDGTPITSDDVAFAIARMAFRRPDFPVISEIKGLQEWRTAGSPLRTYPEGLRVSGRQILIQFVRDVPNPLFRFCLELFSIVPRSSFDLDNNRLRVDRPAASGNYEIEREEPSRIVFKRRFDPDHSHGIRIPERVTFQYFEQDPDLTDSAVFPAEMVVSGVELTLLAQRIDLEALGYSVTWTPASSFAALLLNPEIPPFDRVECRRIFAAAFRRTLGDILGPHGNIQPGLIPALVPGYLSANSLEADIGQASCETGIAGVEVPWAKYPKGQNDFFGEAISRTAYALGMTLKEPSVHSTQARLEDAFLSGESAFFLGRTGFWPLDATGDIRMLFTPNMHAALRFVWSDGEVVRHLRAIRDAASPSELRLRMEALNRYTYKQAVFNPVAHYRRFWMSTGKHTLREIPLAVQSPYPWQVFKVK